MGMDFTELWRVMAIKQKPWMRKFKIKTILTEAEPTAEFCEFSPGKLNSSFFGKQTEIIRKRKRVEFVFGYEKRKKTNYFYWKKIRD